MLFRDMGRNCGSAAVRTFAGLVLASFLAACSLMPALNTPTKNLPFGSAVGPEEATRLSTTAWWKSFQDPVLDQLVIQGLDNNLTLQQALERVRAAEATLRGSGGVVAADGQAKLERRGGDNRNTVTERSGSFGVSWLIDLFGLARFERDAARSDLKSTAAESEAVRMIFLSQITEAYVDLRFFEANVQLKRRDVVSRRRTLEDTRTLVEAGEATQLELSQAEALLNGARADLPILEAQAQRQRNRIATLLGRPAGTMPPSGTGNQPVPHTTLKDGIPANLVRNRPDVRRAEYAYGAAVARLGVAKAQLYPSLRLNGNIQAGSTGGGDLSAWSFGPALNIPIFNQGRLKANVDVAEATAQEAYLAWREVVLTSIEEVESSLYAVQKYSSAVAASRELVNAYTRSLDFARTLAGSQQVTLLVVIETERRASEGRETLTSNLRQLARQYIALNVALGAGYATGQGAGATVTTAAVSQ